MSYKKHYILVDQVINHFDGQFETIRDPFLVSRYVGFLSVSAVTVYELAIKEIFIDFSRRKHKVFGNFIENHYERLNGRIRVSDLRKSHIPRFGEKYVGRFDKKIAYSKNATLRTDGVDFAALYGNLITWRNSFAHEGFVPNTASYQDVKQAYEQGKKVIECLASTMTR
ncbi:MAG: hypothetical protein GVY28_14120 [Alphaproteobacteria bacterium]|jgi:hypothetical protein|nr:hypothetical protein [Alphaproteobacteria bacterium]